MKMNRIGEYLDELFPNPQCELVYHTDYELLIAIVLSAQSTDKRVNQVTSVLFSKYPSLEALKEAKIGDIEAIIRSVGSYHKKAVFIHEMARILLDTYQGVVPRDQGALIQLPGVGRKTSNVFLSEYYGDAYIGVDTHVERVSKRLGLASSKDTVLKVEEKLMKKFPKQEWARRHLQLVLFGRYYCKAVKPECKSCAFTNICHEKKKNM